MMRHPIELTRKKPKKTLENDATIPYSRLHNLMSVGLWSFDFRGPKKQDLWPKIIILQGNCCILRIDKIGHSFQKNV